MPTYNLDWDSAGANGSFTLNDGSSAVGVDISTTTNSSGQTVFADTGGSEQQSGLWASYLDEAVTSTMTFDSPVANLSFEIFDIDQIVDQWDDQMTILATNAAGEQVAVNFLNLGSLHSVNGDTLYADGTGTSSVDNSGASTSVNVSIPGPISELTFIFEVGDSHTTTGVFGISNITLDAALPDGIVSGSSGDDLIDLAYTGDPEGDMVTTGDDVIQAGSGNDTIFADQGNDTAHGGDGDDFISGGFGNDTLYGGAGNDTINGDEGDDIIHGGDGADTAEMGTGNDTFYGGAGNDTVNGDYGDDILHGGTGDDFLRGSFGNDTIYSGGAGEGDDYLWGGYGDDTFVIENSFGNDSISGENQQEVLGDTLDLSGVTDDLTIDLTQATQGNGAFSDGTYTADYNQIENIILGAGTDTLILADNSGEDRVEGFTAPTTNADGSVTGHDRLDVSDLTRDNGANPVTTRDVTVTDDGSGNAVLTFPGGESITLVGVAPSAVDDPAELEALGIPAAPDGVITGTGGNDFIGPGYTDGDGDVIDANDAILPGETGDDDIIEAGAGDDQVYSGAGNDEVDAGTGNDTVFGGSGDDVISGQDGDDTIFGEAGNDILSGGAGADKLVGGADRDKFINVTAGDQILGGETGDDYDVLDLTGSGPFAINYDPQNSENGTVDFLDGNGAVTGSLTFEGIEEIVPCFTPGTKIATSRGDIPVEKLREGDKVITRDNGYQEIRWAGKRLVDRQWMNRAAHLQPVLIRKDALGDGIPAADMMVSPNHRMLITEAAAQAYFNDSEVLVAAKFLVGRPGITKADISSVCYHHVMFDRHEVVYAQSAWSESFQPGDYVMSAMGQEQRSELFELFPELENHDMSNSFSSARRVVRRHEAALLGAKKVGA